MLKEELKKVEEELKNRLRELTLEAPFKEGIKERLLKMEFGSINHQVVAKQFRKGGREYRYKYHQLTANIKTEDGKWKTIPLKNVRYNGETLKRLSAVYNAIKRIEKTLEELKEVGEI